MPSIWLLSGLLLWWGWWGWRRRCSRSPGPGGKSAGSKPLYSAPSPVPDWKGWMPQGRCCRLFHVSFQVSCWGFHLLSGIAADATQFPRHFALAERRLSGCYWRQRCL
ncbi:MAG: IPTL-CTERM sorting domain-containing protein [Proteobacteria bacterium]|nr:IPTL-CTERM sorting domain-containing protein [Pseudomonadota bacterium]